MTEKQITTRNAATGNGTRIVSTSLPALPNWPELDEASRDETAPRNRVIRRKPAARRRTAAEIAIEAIRAVYGEAAR